MRTLARWACMTVAAMVAVCRADNAAPPAAPPPHLNAERPAIGFAATEAKFTDGRLLLSESAKELLVPVAPVLEPSDPGVKTAIECRPAPGGADLVISFTNLTDGPRPITGLSLGMFTLSSGVRLHDMRLPFTTQTIDLNTYIARPAVYPLETYSPAVVFADQRLAIGVSVAYPLMAYRHDVEITLLSPRDLKVAGKRGWVVKIGFSRNTKDRGAMRPAVLAPRESRRYTVSIRAAPADEWLRTLLPYREAFRALYGPVKYSRDGAPLAGFEVASVPSISDENPMGWVMPFRPDELGWTNVARFLASEFDGWPTLLVANPSGLYNQQRQNNPPFQFASRWLTNRSLQSATDSYNGFPAVVKQGKKIALRWGHSASVAKAWNPEALEPLNPDNSEHARIAFAEANLAVKAGATTILLDSFSHRASPVWDLVRWAEVLRMRYPEVRFVAAPVSCDVLHGALPGCMDAAVGLQKPARREDPFPIAEPFAIADFLLPGHETWASVRFEGESVEASAVEGEAHRLAGLGYVPLVWCRRAANVSSVIASPTWESTVPADLRLPAGPKPKDAEKAVTTGATKRKGLEKITVRPAESVKPPPAEAVSSTEQQRLIAEALRRLRSTSAKANAEAAKKPKIRVASPGSEPKQPAAEKKEKKDEK